MKKLSTAVIALTLLSAAASSSWAAFTSIKKQAVTAVVTTAGSKTVNFGLKIRDHNDVFGGSPNRTQITWTGIDPTNLGANPWKIADQVIVATTTITDLTGGIQLVTDNTLAAANPHFVDPSPTISSNTDSNPAGLLLVPATGVDSSLTLPLAWSIKDSTKTVGSANLATGIGASDPNTGSNTGADNKYQWLYIVDKKSPAIDLNGSGVLGDSTVNGNDSVAFADGQTFSTIASKDGIHFGQADTDFGGGAGTKTSYIYFQSNFQNALVGNTYKTNQLTVEAFTE